MEIIPIFLNFILCSFLIYNDIVIRKFQRFASSIFILFYFILFIIVPLLLHTFFDGARSIVSGNSNFYFDSSVYLIINIYGTIILFSFILHRLFFDKFFYKEKKIESFRCNFKEMFGIASIFYMSVFITLGAFIFFYSTGMTLDELTSTSRFGWFNNPNAFIPGIAISHYFFSLTPLLVFLFLRYENKTKGLFFFIIGILGVISYGVISQDRKWVVYIFSGFLGYLYRYHKNSLPVSFNLIFFSSIIGGFLFISQFVRDFGMRMVLGQTELESFFVELNSWFAFLVEFGDISYFYRASCEAIFQTFEHGIIEPLGIVRRNLLFFIPVDWSFGLKPEDLSAIFSDIVKGEDSVRRGNMPPGFFGLLVISFGVVFPLLLLCLLPWILSKCDRIIIRNNSIIGTVLISSFMSSFLLMMRGDDSSAIYFIVFNCIIIYFIHLISNFKFK